MTANADLMILNSSGQIVAISTRGSTAIEHLELDLAAGMYQVRVRCAHAASATSYRLRLAA